MIRFVEIEDIGQILSMMEQIKEDETGLSVKEKASHMAGLLQEVSDQKGISLKLRKKSAKSKEM